MPYKDPHRQKEANKYHAQAYRKRQGMIAGMTDKIARLENYQNYLIILCVFLFLCSCFLLHAAYGHKTIPVETRLVFLGKDKRGQWIKVDEVYKGRIESTGEREAVRQMVESVKGITDATYVGKVEWQITKNEAPKVVIKK